MCQSVQVVRAQRLVEVAADGAEAAYDVGIPAVSRDNLQGGFHMKQAVPHEDEPIGIVISRGWEPETTPRFSAYVWAPFPDDEIETDVPAA